MDKPSELRWLTPTLAMVGSSDSGDFVLAHKGCRHLDCNKACADRFSLRENRLGAVTHPSNFRPERFSVLRHFECLHCGHRPNLRDWFVACALHDARANRE